MQLQQKQETLEAGVSDRCCCRREALERASQEAEAERVRLGGRDLSYNGSPVQWYGVHPGKFKEQP